MTAKARVRCVCTALCSSLWMLHTGFTVSLLLSAMSQWCTKRQCKLWESLIQTGYRMDDDSCLPLAEIHKSKHGEPCERHSVSDLDTRMPHRLIESFLGMCGFDYALSSTEIGLFGRSFWRLPVGFRITISKDSSWQATDTHTGAKHRLARFTPPWTARS